MNKQENPDMPHALAHLCSHAGEGLICGPCGTLAYEATRASLNDDTAFAKELGAVNALEGLVAWLGELGEKHPDFAGSTGMAMLYVERYATDNFPRWKHEKR